MVMGRYHLGARNTPVRESLRVFRAEILLVCTICILKSKKGDAGAGHAESTDPATGE